MYGCDSVIPSPPLFYLLFVLNWSRWTAKTGECLGTFITSGCEVDIGGSGQYSNTYALSLKASFCSRTVSSWVPPPYVHLTSLLTWWMLPGLPVFHCSSALMHYCECKQAKGKMVSCWVICSIVIRWLAGCDITPSWRCLGINSSTQVLRESLKVLALLFRKGSWTSSAIFSSICGSGFMVSWSVTRMGCVQVSEHSSSVFGFPKLSHHCTHAFKSQTCKFVLHPNRLVPSDEWFSSQGKMTWIDLYHHASSYRTATMQKYMWTVFLPLILSPLTVCCSAFLSELCIHILSVEWIVETNLPSFGHCKAPYTLLHMGHSSLQVLRSSTLPGDLVVLGSIVGVLTLLK